MNIDCSICGHPIVPEHISGWEEGNNAAPINDGRCCNDCNGSVVVPRRIFDATKEKR